MNKEERKVYMKKWNRNKYLKDKEKILEKNRLWKKNNKTKSKETHKLYKQNHPWRRFFRNINNRCNYPKHKSYKNYGGKGIKNLITVEELKELWFRDKAYLLKRPSIDRKDSKGNYELSNCRFIELKDNEDGGRRNRWRKNES